MEGAIVSRWNGKQSFLQFAGHEIRNDTDAFADGRSDNEAVSKKRVHRRVKPVKSVTFGALFAGYDHSDKPIEYSSPWLDDGLAERSQLPR